MFSDNKRYLLFLYFLVFEINISFAQTSKDSLVVLKIVEIKIEGNKITKEKIILRELTFDTNDSNTVANFESMFKQSKRNLMNAALFNFVTIDYQKINEREIVVTIKVTERWYVWPIPILEIADRNFNIWWQSKQLKRLNYGCDIVWNNFRGRKESLRFTIKLGYSERYGIVYTLPNLGAKQRSGLSLAYSFARNHEIGYKSLNNVLLFYNDNNKYTRNELSAKLRYSYRKNIFNIHAIEFRFNQLRVSDTVKYFASTYLDNRKSNLDFFALNYIFVTDHRDYKPYPLQGYVFFIDATQNGFGILKNETSNFLKIESGYRYHHQIKNRFYGAYSAKIKWSSAQRQPYYIQRGLGYGDYIRGYEYFVIDGHNYCLAKTNFKFQLLKPTTVDLNILKGEKFDKINFAIYINTYFDAGYASDTRYFSENKLNNKWQYGYGIGLDLVTYYDKVFRLDFSMNKLGEKGIFIHYAAPI